MTQRFSDREFSDRGHSDRWRRRWLRGLAVLLLPVLCGIAGPGRAQQAAAPSAAAVAELYGIAEGICTELMAGPRAHRRLNGYQIAALPLLPPAPDGAAVARIGFLAENVFYCRRDGKAVWATYDVDGIVPPDAILALDQPPGVLLDLRFHRVAPPGPATEPDRLQAAAAAAKGALDRVAGRGVVDPGRPPATAGAGAPRRGPLPIVPGSLDAVAGAPPAGPAEAGAAAPAGAVSRR